MPETTRAQLMRTLLAGYTKLKDRLAQRLGSQDLASDALHETWLRLESNPNLAPVKNPDAYLYRAALNTASNLRLANTRRLSQLDVEEIMSIADDMPGPAIIAENRAEVAAVERALAELTQRQREIFHATFLGDVSHHVLAERHGVTVRTIQKELQRAVEHCARRLGKRNHFATGRSRLSGKKEGLSQ